MPHENYFKVSKQYMIKILIKTDKLNSSVKVLIYKVNKHRYKAQWRS